MNGIFLKKQNGRHALLLLAWLAMGAPLFSASAADRIWSAVIIANNSANPKAAPAQLKPVAARLQRVFGYNQFEIIGSDSAEIEDGAEKTLNPTKTFWLNLKARRASLKEARGGFLLNLQLYQEKRAIVDTVMLLAPNSPLFFRGPNSSRGQVIIVLQVGQ
jgi:hypothetical protein